MKLSSKSEYALLALTYLARIPAGALVHADEIVKAQQIPKPFLQQILHALNRARVVRSVKGKEGGYALARNPKEITIAEVVRLFDGALAPTHSVSVYFYGPSPIERELGLLNLFREVRELVAAKLESTVLADLL